MNGFTQRSFQVKWFLSAVLFAIAISAPSTLSATEESALPSYAPSSPDDVIEPPDIARIVLDNAKIVSAKQQLHATTIKFESVVQPDGNLEIGGLGSIDIAGLTCEQAAEAVQQHFKATKGKSARVDCDRVVVEIAEANSKVAYIIHKSELGDTVQRMPLLRATTVRQLLSEAVWSHPVELRKCKVTLIRNEGTQGEQERRTEINFSVNETSTAEDSTRLLEPGDRVVVAEPTNEIRPTSHEAPLPIQPPAPYGGVAAFNPKSQMLFRFQVIEDTHDQLIKLGALKSGVLSAKIAVLQGSLEILAENKLVKVLANPTIVTTVDRPLSFSVGGERPDEPGRLFSGIELKLDASITEGKIAADMIFEYTVEGRTMETDTSVLVDLGHAVLLRTATLKGRAPVYLLVAPEIVEGQ